MNFENLILVTCFETLLATKNKNIRNGGSNMTLLKILISLFVVVIFGFGAVKSYFEALSQESDYDSEIKAVTGVQRIAFAILVAFTLVFTLMSSIFFTTEQEKAVVSTFGHVTSIDTSGPHFKIPFISKKYVVDSTIKGIPIGYVFNDGNDKDFDEKKAKGYVDPVMITNDFNFIDIDFYAEYRIVDPVEYIYGSKEPEVILENIIQAAIRNTVGQYTIDEVPSRPP